MAKWFITLGLLGAISPALAETLAKDPTQPMHYQVEQPETAKEEAAQVYTLTSLLLRNKQSWAVINGEKVAIGEKVSGATLLKIADNKVLLQVNGQNQWVPIARPAGLKISR